MAVGQAPFVTNNSTDVNTYDGNYAWEWYYKFQVSDNIAVTPAIFYLSRPQGQATGNSSSLDSFGYLIQTTFKF
jgi:carbohydrate-selective porin OprB